MTAIADHHSMMKFETPQVRIEWEARDLYNSSEEFSDDDTALEKFKT
jgi:hypothetical protein